MNVNVWWSLGPSRDEWKEGGRESEKRGKRDAREKRKEEMFSNAMERKRWGKDARLLFCVYVLF